MAEIASNLIELGEIDEAEKICEIGLTRGIWLNRDQAKEIQSELSQWYAEIYKELAEIYELKNMDTEIPYLYETAYTYSKRSNLELESATLPLLSLASYYYKKGKFELLLPIYERIIDYAKDNKLTNDPYYAKILWFKANAYSKVGKNKEAISLYEMALRLAKKNKVLEDDSYSYVESGNLILEYYKYGDFERIDKLLKEINSTEEYVTDVIGLVILLSNKLDFDKSQSYLNKLNNDRCLSSSRGRQILEMSMTLDTLKKIKSKFDKLELHDHSLKFGSEEWLSNNWEIIDCSLLLKDTLETLKQTQKRIDALENNRETESERYLRSLYLYTQLLLDKKEFKTAYVYNKKLVGLIKAFYGQESKVYYNVCSNLTFSMIKNAETGFYVDDIGIFQEQLLLSKKIYGIESPEYSTQLHNYGRWLFFQNKFKDSIDALKEAKRIQIKNNGKAFERTVKYLLESEKCYLKETI